MSERTYEELMAENEKLNAAFLLQSLSTDKQKQKLYRRLIDWQAVSSAENKNEAFHEQLEAVHKDFPELFEESRKVLPTFAPVGKARRRGFSEAARGIMGLRR